jgi:hypothetical protein
VLPPWPACLLTPILEGIKLTDEDSNVHVYSTQFMSFCAKAYTLPYLAKVWDQS